MKITLTFNVGEKEIILEENEAEELYKKLKKFYETKTEYVPITYPVYPFGTNPWWWDKIWYTTTDGTWQLTEDVKVTNDNTIQINDLTYYVSSEETNAINSYLIQ